MWAALIILLVACGLMVTNYTLSEAFANPPGMCGVYLPPCAHGTRCMNGYCFSDIQPKMPPTSGLPVYP